MKPIATRKSTLNIQFSETSTPRLDGRNANEISIDTLLVFQACGLGTNGEKQILRFTQNDKVVLPYNLRNARRHDCPSPQHHNIVRKILAILNVERSQPVQKFGKPGQ
jgi:hypothetical protein